MSWIKSIIHPSKCARQLVEQSQHIDQYEEYTESIELQLKVANTSIEQLKNEMHKMKSELNANEEANNFLTSQLADTRRELTETRAELDEANRQLQIAEEISSLIEKFEQQKIRYEQRITRLKNELKEARAALQIQNPTQHPDSDIYPIKESLIKSSDNAASRYQTYKINKSELSDIPPTQKNHETKTGSSTKLSSQIITDNPFTEEEPNKAKMPEKKKTQQNTQNHDEDDDWLRPLPDIFKL